MNRKGGTSRLHLASLALRCLAPFEVNPDGHWTILAELHLTDHFLQVSFRHLGQNWKYLSFQFKKFSAARQSSHRSYRFHFSYIGTDVNEVQCWDRFRCPNICRELLNIKIRALFDKGNHKTSFPRKGVASEDLYTNNFVWFTFTQPLQAKLQYDSNNETCYQPAWNK